MTSPATQRDELWGKILPASALDIRSWSYGTVSSSRLLDFHTRRFHAEGPFSEKIFGSVSERRCGCGKFAGAEHVNIICDDCGVKVGSREQRQQRFGSIELRLPILHPWWYGNDRRPIEILTALSTRQVRAILSRKSAIDFGTIAANDSFAVVPIRDTDDLPPSVLGRRKTGSEAILHLLWCLLGDQMESVLRNQIEAGTLKQRGARRRLRLITKLNRIKVKPEDFVLEVIPVVPPGLRWIDLDEDGQIHVDPVTRCYQRMIAIDRSIRRLLEKAPGDCSRVNAFPIPLVRGLERRLRQSVRQLFAQLLVGGRTLEKVYRSSRRRDERLRRSWPGVPPTVGRSAIVVPDSKLRIDQCRVPRPENLNRCSPSRTNFQFDEITNFSRPENLDFGSLADFIRERSGAKSNTLLSFPPVRRPERLLALQAEWSKTGAIHVHPLLATWLGFSFDGQQALSWQPIRKKSLEDLGKLGIESTAFDIATGDGQWKLGADALLGCYLATWETAEQQQAHDNFNRHRYTAAGRPMLVHSASEVRLAVESGRCQLQSPVILKLPRGKSVVESVVSRYQLCDIDAASRWTTAGRVLFNELLLDSLPFFDVAIGELEAKRIIAMVIAEGSLATTLRLIERLTSFGTETLTATGFSLSANDLHPPENKNSHLVRARAEVLKTQKHYDRGIICRGEADAKIWDIWSNARTGITQELHQKLDQDPKHPLHMIRKILPGFDQKHLSELSGMIGLVSMQVHCYPLIPIANSFSEGLTAHDYFQVACRARRGQVARVLKRRDARRLTKRLANVAQNVVISEVDCGTRNGVVKHGAGIDDRAALPLERQILGRVCNETILDPITGQCVAAESTLITPDIAQKIAALGIDHLEVRSPLTCEAKDGICQQCYGADLRMGQRSRSDFQSDSSKNGLQIHSTDQQSRSDFQSDSWKNKLQIGSTGQQRRSDDQSDSGRNGLEIRFPGQLVKQGTAVGTLAALAIGNLLEKLLMVVYRTGVAQRFEDSCQIRSNSRGRVSLAKVDFAFNEQRRRVALAAGTIEIVDHQDQVLEHLDVPQGAVILKAAGDQVHPRDEISEWDPHFIVVYAKSDGIDEYHDIDPGRNVQYAADSTAGATNAGVWTVHEFRSRKHPCIHIVDLGGQTVDFCFLSTGSRLYVSPGQIVNRGFQLAHLPRLREGTHDWYIGGFPRFEDLIFAREPAQAAVLAEVSGRVEQIVKHDNRQWTIWVRFGDLFGADIGNAVAHEIDMNRHGRLLVNERDMVNAGDCLTSGELSLRELLRITGTDGTGRILLAELFKCFRCQTQPLDLDQRHLELIVSQMLGFARVEGPGDTILRVGDVISRSRLMAIHGQMRSVRKIVEQGDSLMPPGRFVSRWQFDQEVMRIENFGGQLPTYTIPWPASALPLLLGIDEAALRHGSFLTSQGFSFNMRALAMAALDGREYHLSTVKDCVANGGLIPVGSGWPGSSSVSD